MTPEEWNDLKGKVDDSFWVMRIIGTLRTLHLLSQTESSSQATRRCQMTTTAFRVGHTGGRFARSL